MCPHIWQLQYHSPNGTSFSHTSLSANVHEHCVIKKTCINRYWSYVLGAMGWQWFQYVLHDILNCVTNACQSMCLWTHFCGKLMLRLYLWSQAQATRKRFHTRPPHSWTSFKVLFVIILLVLKLCQICQFEDLEAAPSVCPWNYKTDNTMIGSTVDNITRICNKLYSAIAGSAYHKVSSWHHFGKSYSIILQSPASIRNSEPNLGHHNI